MEPTSIAPPSFKNEPLSFLLLIDLKNARIAVPLKGNVFLLFILLFFLWLKWEGSQWSQNTELNYFIGRKNIITDFETNNHIILPVIYQSKEKHNRVRIIPDLEQNNYEKLAKADRNRMSSNPYPEPPKFTSANLLMKKPVEPKAPQEEVMPETEAEDKLGTMFPALPVIPEKVEETVVKPVETVAETPEPAVESAEEVSPVEAKDEGSAKELTSSEVSETDASLGQTENLEQETKTGDIAPEKNAEESEEDEEDPYGGAWGIIKHTGYVPVAVWAVLTAVITGASAYFFAPGDFTWIALGVLGFMTGVIAAVDRKTHLIKNQHTIATAIVTIPLSVIAALQLSAWNILFGALAAVLVFGVFIFLIIKVNFGSGGDIKFSPIPAFALGVVNPLISALWLFYALIITVILLVVRKEKRTSFGEGMAISFPFAIASVYALYSMAGLSYMDTATV
jgi:Flp pilus assembly protein protease CpaA